MKAPDSGLQTPMPWLLYALASALFAALTAILAKLGVEGVPSNFATALRTLVVLAFAWGIVFWTGEYRTFATLSRRTLGYLVLSGVATGCSWLAYFRALQLGPANRVAPVDKLSLPLTILLAALVLREAVSWRVIAGVALMVVGALLTMS